MIRNAILSTLALAIFVSCSEKKTEQTAVEAIPVKVQKLEKTTISRTFRELYPWRIF